MMNSYRRDILIDTRTSCSKNEAAAILLGRRTYDPIYPDHNPEGDPELVREQFEEWLDLSIYEELNDERDGILTALDDALEAKDQQQIDACRHRVIECDATIRRAKLILCDIDDELAKGAASSLRIGQSQQTGQLNIALTSLKAWAKDRNYMSLAVDIAPTQPAPPAQNDANLDEPLLTKTGGMSPTAARSFLVTFALLLEAFLVHSQKFKSESGTGFNEEELATHLNNISLPNGRKGNFLGGQSVSSIEARIKEVLKVSNSELIKQREKKAHPSK